MGVISKTECYCDGVRYHRKVSVNSSGVFSINLPPVVASALQVDAVTGKTLQEAEASEKVHIRQYQDSQTEKSRVIVYDVRVEARICRADGTWFQAGPSYGGTGATLSVFVGVYDMTCRKVQGRGELRSFSVVPSSIPSSVSRDVSSHDLSRFSRVPWTQEREDWFARVATSLEVLLMALHDKTKDAEALDGAVASGALALPDRVVGVDLAGGPDWSAGAVVAGLVVAPVKLGVTPRSDVPANQRKVK